MVWQKYGGHCAYCGKEITYADMQIDHYVPKNRGLIMRYNEQERKVTITQGNDDISNYMPSCRACNYRKRDMSIEQFRTAIKEQAEGLLNGNSKFQVRMSIAYGLITPNFDTPVKFYYEQFKNY